MDKSDLLGSTMILLVVGMSLYYCIVNQDSFLLKCVVSNVDGNKYCVVERT